MSMRTAGWVVALLTACTSNRAPVFEPIGDRVVTVGQSVQFPVRAFDRDGDRVRLGARGLPIGSRFNRDVTPAEFTWSPVASDATAGGRPHTVTFVAADEDGASVEIRIVLSVFPGVTEPRFTSPSAYVLNAETEPCLDVFVTVRDDDDVEVGLALIEGPSSAVFETEPKRARVQWCPSTDEVARRRVFGFVVTAWDQDSATAVEHRITVAVLGDPEE